MAGVHGQGEEGLSVSVAALHGQWGPLILLFYCLKIIINLNNNGMMMKAITTGRTKQFPTLIQHFLAVQ